MEIERLLARPSTFLLLTAPPASGKTSLVLELHRALGGRTVFLSPLRALAREFFGRARSEGLRPCLLESRGGIDPAGYARGRTSLLVATPEVLDGGLWGAFEELRPLFVVDEFHLFYSWGQGFRPVLWEALMGAANTGASILALSATVGGGLLGESSRDFSVAMEGAFHLDLGNRVFLRAPERTVYMGVGARRVFRLILAHCLDKKPGELFLVFCRHRHEVEALTAALVRLGIRALGCVGGGVAAFQERLGRDGAEVIVATSCLGHGVNLPCPGKVFIAYRTGDRDMWLQMAARGGRRGRAFRLYECDAFGLGVWPKIRSLAGCLFTDLYYRARLLWGL